MLVYNNLLTALEKPVRQVIARVELYNGSTLSHTFNYTDRLHSFTIERVGESKFFGFGICQKANIKIIDTSAALDITTANNFNIFLGAGSEYIKPFPSFSVSEVHRNENTNELSITAYDAIYKAASHTVSELNIETPYTLRTFAAACSSLLGLSLNIKADSGFEITYDSGANFEGTETIREALNAIAETTQTIYFINKDNELTFVRLDVSGAAVYNITKDRYFTLDSGTNRRLVNITHTTELGDNVSAALDVSGTTQFIRENPFLELRDDVGALLDAAIDRLGGLTINQFSCNWRGNYLLEIGDKISLTTKEGGTVFSYLLDDTLTYDGTFSQQTQWRYEDNENETAANPSTLGESLKQTYARVDKANKEIALVASETANNANSISSLLINTNNITASVEKIEKDTAASIETINGELSTLSNSVAASITAEDVKIEIRQELANGVESVKTNTGFTFNSDGLTVSKSGSEMDTKITEDGMIVSKNGEAVLTANNIGVDAVNLHATTYLIVGENSRFEDYGNRTGCFWIGG